MGEEILVKVCLGAQLAWEFVRSRTVHVAPVYNGVAFALCHNWVKDWWIILVLFLFTRLNIWLRKFSFVLRYLRKVLFWKICFNHHSCLSIFCHQTTSVPAMMRAAVDHDSLLSIWCNRVWFIQSWFSTLLLNVFSSTFLNLLAVFLESIGTVEIPVTFRSQIIRNYFSCGLEIWLLICVELS